METNAENLRKGRSVFSLVFERDRGRCRYCDKNLVETLDGFVSIHLDHLKPKAKSGSDNDINNRVIACNVCNLLKGDFDPIPDVFVSGESFDAVLQAAKAYITEKRLGERKSSLYQDFLSWEAERKLWRSP